MWKVISAVPSLLPLAQPARPAAMPATAMTAAPMRARRRRGTGPAWRMEAL